MSTLVQVEQGEIMKTQAGKEYLLLNFVVDETGERRSAAGWRQEHISMWEAGGIPPVVRLDLDSTKKDGKTYWNIKDIIPVNPDDVVVQTDPPEPGYDPAIDQFSSGPTRDDLFGDGDQRQPTKPNLSLIHISEPTRPY